MAGVVGGGGLREDGVRFGAEADIGVTPAPTPRIEKRASKVHLEVASVLLL